MIDKITENLELHECDLTCKKVLNCGLHRYVLSVLSRSFFHRYFLVANAKTTKGSVPLAYNRRLMRYIIITITPSR